MLASTLTEAMALPATIPANCKRLTGTAKDVARFCKNTPGLNAVLEMSMFKMICTVTYGAVVVVVVFLGFVVVVGVVVVVLVVVVLVDVVGFGVGVV